VEDWRQYSGEYLLRQWQYAAVVALVCWLHDFAIVEQLGALLVVSLPQDDYAA